MAIVLLALYEREQVLGSSKILVRLRQRDDSNYLKRNDIS